jgi:hypothetical protein
MWEFVDKVIYINLDCRPDRREQVEHELKVFGDKVFRFSAIEDRLEGAVGNCKSHIAALQLALDSGVNNVLIVEDDVTWNKYEEGYNKLSVLTRNKYDVICLGASAVTFDQTNLNLKECNAAHAYLVSREYIPTLIHNYNEGLVLREQTRRFDLYNFDCYWNECIKKDNWFVIVPNLLYQRPSPNFHNTERIIDYRNLFLLEFNYSAYAQSKWPHLIDHGTPEEKQKILNGTFFETVPSTQTIKIRPRKFIWNL